MKFTKGGVEQDAICELNARFIPSPTSLLRELVLARSVKLAVQTWKLAAILAVDVVGYTRLWRRKRPRRSSACARISRSYSSRRSQNNHGRIFKLMGDGFLVEFGRLDAVECAVRVQQAIISTFRQTSPYCR